VKIKNKTFKLKGGILMDSDEMLNRLRDDIIRISDPKELLLFSHKQSPSGDLCSVKLCVIICGGDSRRMEHKLYVEVESDLSFDVLVYTESEWEKLLENRMSFAARIKKTGRVLYAAD
jgi:hypothetical protein